jgi:hypothetical protein
MIPIKPLHIGIGASMWQWCHAWQFAVLAAPFQVT